MWLSHRHGGQQVSLQHHRFSSLVSPDQRAALRQVRSPGHGFRAHRRDRAWFFDGLETEYDNIYIQGLPPNADTNHLLRGSNLAKAQINLTPANILTTGLLFNDYHSPYDGLSPLTPQESTTKRDTIAWLPYLRDQYSFAGRALLQLGLGVVRIRDGYEPHGDSPYEITPEQTQGSYFENLAAHSGREKGMATLYSAAAPRCGAP